MISEDVRVRDGDLVAALRSLRRGGPEAGPWSALVRQLQDALPTASRSAAGEPGLPDDLAVGLVVALAHPDRIARLRTGSSAYLMASGTGAVLPAGSRRSRDCRGSPSRTPTGGPVSGTPRSGRRPR